MTSRRLAPSLLCTLCLTMWLSSGAHAALISRSITIDGTMGDWTAAPDVTTNAGQFSTDCEIGQSCELDSFTSTGRDLKKFTFTWDDNYLYFYVERYASSSNTTNWLFYLDENANGFMESGEQIFRVDWKGSNRNTDAYLCPYYPVDTANGDALSNAGVGDGHTLPGSSSNNECGKNQIYSTVGGSSSGLEMESRVSWTELGLSGPQNMLFHISSSTGMNLPSQIVDNMDGTGSDGGGDEGGGELFPPDLAVAINSAAPDIHTHQTMTFNITVSNVYYDDFTDIVTDISLPPQFQYQSHVAPAGTSFVDSDSDGMPDQWQIPLLTGEQDLTLQLNAQAQPVDFAMNTSTTATLSAWATSADSEPVNNTASVAVQVLPVPELSIARVASSATAVPGDQIRVTSTITNNAPEAIAQSVVLTEAVGRFVAFRLDTFGAGQPVQYNDGSPSSGLGGIQSLEFSADGGTDWSYVPVSGGGGAAAGYDRNVTHFRATMSGTMNAGSSFSLLYDIQVD